MKGYSGELSWWDRIMMAITFAEAGEGETARELLKKQTKKHRLESKIRKETEKRTELRL